MDENSKDKKENRHHHHTDGKKKNEKEAKHRHKHKHHHHRKHATHQPTCSPASEQAPIAQGAGWFAKAVTWLKDYVFQPTFKRQQQTATAYSLQFSRTLEAIGKRFSANDDTQPNGIILNTQTLRFSATSEKTTTKATTATEVNSAKAKPTLH